MRTDTRKTEDLLQAAAPYNPRSISEHDLDALRRSLKFFGVVEPVVFNERSGHIVGGHQRVKAAEAEGIEELPVVLVDLDDPSEKQLNLALKRITGSWDEPALAALLAELDDSGADLALTGFDDEEVATLLETLIQQDLDGSDEDFDQVPEPPDEPTIQRGDVFQLGPHRLMCGDAADPADMAILLDGHQVQLVNTDPPYNVKVEPRSNNAIAAGLSSFSGTHHQGFDSARHPDKRKPTGKMRPKDRPLENDFVTDEQFAVLLRAWFKNMADALEPGRTFYIWGGYANIANYPSALVESDLYFSQAIIWVKEHPVLTRKDFMGNHEWCFYGWKKGAAHYFAPDINNATDVWSVKKVNPQSMVHLTEKPVELAERALTYSSKIGERVLDPFGGSGSTLIAAQRMKRQALLMEIDPAYCHVIIERWETVTNEKAEQVASTPA